MPSFDLAYENLAEPVCDGSVSHASRLHAPRGRIGTRSTRKVSPLLCFLRCTTHARDSIVSIIRNFKSTLMSIPNEQYTNMALTSPQNRISLSPLILVVTPNA